jgi:hypothetical protein
MISISRAIDSSYLQRQQQKLALLNSVTLLFTLKYNDHNRYDA